MAKNGPKRHGRIGQVKNRDQVKSRKNPHWTKRDMGSGKFMDQKFNAIPFKGVRKDS